MKFFSMPLIILMIILQQIEDLYIIIFLKLK